MFDSIYENPNLFELVSKSTSFDGSYTYETQHLINLETKEHVKRTLKFKDNLTKTQINDIMNRTKWEKFGQAINFNNTQETSENIFMEFNPEILKSNKSQKVIQNMLKNPFNKEKIKVLEGKENELNEILTNNYNKLKNNYNKSILDKNLKLIVDYNVQEDKKSNPKEISKKVNNKTGGYVPPHLRNNNKDKQQTNNKTKKYEIKEGESKSIRISNLPSDINENDIRDWLLKFNYRRLRITLPKDKKTHKPRDFCFVNFESRIEAQNSIEKLNKQIFDYCLVNVEFSKF